MAALERIDSPLLKRDIEASWDGEQRSATGYDNMLRDAVHQLAVQKETIAKRVAEGRCPKCGLRLTAPRGGIPDGAAVYCSNCGARVR